MTKIKLCGIRREEDIQAINELLPEYIGFVFASASKRYVSCERAKELKALLNPNIQAVGVFVNETPSVIVDLVNDKTIDLVQLHGDEDEQYIESLRKRISSPIIQAFRIRSSQDIEFAEKSKADYILLDSGGGTGKVFDWDILKEIERPYFLAGGLTPTNLKEALVRLVPYAVDASSSLETDGRKDKQKMTDFVEAVRYRKER